MNVWYQIQLKQHTSKSILNLILLTGDIIIASRHLFVISVHDNHIDIHTQTNMKCTHLLLCGKLNASALRAITTKMRSDVLLLF